MYAVIETGGKQYQVTPGEKVDIELLEQHEGDVTFDKVLFVRTDDNVKVGTPLLKGVTVTGSIVKEFKTDKVLVFKKKRKKQYRRTKGHRQQMLKVLIQEIKGV